MFRLLATIGMCILLTSCTLSIMLTDSHGTDNDVDSAPTTETKTDMKADLSTLPVALKISNI